jgi:hypothetical protein
MIMSNILCKSLNFIIRKFFVICLLFRYLDIPNIYRVTYDSKYFFRGKLIERIGEETHCNLIFVTDYLLEKLISSKRVFVDATFKTVSKPFMSTAMSTYFTRRLLYKMQLFLRYSLETTILFETIKLL